MNSQKLKKSILTYRPIKDNIFENFFHKNEIIEMPTPVILKAKHAYDVYYNRYKLQNNVTKSNIRGYDTLLENLKKQNLEIFIYQFNTEIGFIACFFDNSEILQGVLWNKNKII